MPLPGSMYNDKAEIYQQKRKQQALIIRPRVNRSPCITRQGHCAVSSHPSSETNPSFQLDLDQEHSFLSALPTSSFIRSPRVCSYLPLADFGEPAGQSQSISFHSRDSALSTSVPHILLLPPAPAQPPTVTLQWSRV